MKYVAVTLLAIIQFSAGLFAGANKASNNTIGSKKTNLANQIRGGGMCFTPNKGQIADMDGKLCPDVLYKSDGAGADIYLRKTGISYVYTNMPEVMHKVGEQVENLIKEKIITEAEEQKKKDELLQKEKIRIHRVDMEFLNCNRSISTVNENELDGYNNYYYAHCPNGITNVKQYNKVTYENIYNGIDISYYASTPLNASGDRQSGLKYDLIVKPHADPNQLKLYWKDAESIRLNREGNLVIKTSVNEFQESIPKVYQVINKKIVDVKARYILNETTVSFELGTWNHEHPLIIDPWATYYGGNGVEMSRGLETDNAGNIVISGTTPSSNFPVLGGSQMTIGGGAFDSDAFVLKFSSGGTRLWATYYGGSTGEQGSGIATDNLNQIFLTGTTSSTNFPVFGGTQMTSAGSSDAFLVKFNSAGLRLWATYYGGLYSETTNGVATDNAGNAIIVGYTNSNNFPVLAGHQMIYYASWDIFVVKFNNTGTVQWSTLYGGNDSDYGNSIATDNSNNIVITGSSVSANFPLLAGVQMIYNGTSDAIIVKFNATGVLLWATYYGGNMYESGNDIAIDSSDNIIVAGHTGSNNFPVGSCCGNVIHQAAYGGGSFDATLLKLGPNGTLLWATHYGGNQWDWAFDLTTDENNNVYLLMEAEDVATPSLVDFCTYQPGFAGIEDQLIVKFSPKGTKLCATYLGGTDEDDLEMGGGGMAIYGNFLYLTGQTNGGYPVTPGAFQTTYGGPKQALYAAGGDIFIASICTNICEGKSLAINFTAANTNICTNTLVPFTSTINNSCDTTGYKFQWTFTGAIPSVSDNPKPTILYPTAGTYPVKLVITTPCKKDSLIKTTYITVNNCSCTLTATALSTANESCSGAGDGSAKVTIGNGSGGLYTYSWSNGVSGSTSGTTIPITGLSAGSFTVTITEGSCSAISIVTLTSQNVLIINSATPANVSSCYGGNNGSATVNMSGGNSGLFTYNWSNGSNAITSSLNNSISNLTAGTYSVTITQGSCSVTTAISITQPQKLIVGTSAQWYCNTNTGISTAVPGNGTSPYSFSWSNGQTVATATGLSLGTIYTVTLTDANGCSTTTTSTPSIYPILVTPSSVNLGCNISSYAMVKGGSGSVYSYSWSTGGTGSSISIYTAGTYSVTITNTYGCTRTDIFNITGLNPTSATFTNPTPCVGQPICFTNTGSIGTYTWTLYTPTQVNSNAADLCTTFLTAGSYSLVHKVIAAGCTTTVQKSIVVTNCNAPIVTATGGSVCTGICATVTSNGTGGTNPYTYSWNTGDTSPNINPCPAITTTYTVTITDAGANSSTSTAVVTLNPAITVNTSSTNILCNGGMGSVQANPINGTPAYTYNWSNGGTTSQISGLTSQTYTVTITDSKGCTATSAANLSSPAPLIGQFTKGSATCNGCGCKEWLMVNASGGTSPYSYSWPDGYVNRYKNQLCPGSYTIKVVDKNGCSSNLIVNAP